MGMSFKKIDRLQRNMVYLALGLIFLFPLSCRQSLSNGKATDTNAELSIYFFHLTARCEACLAIEEHTKDLLAKFYKEQIENGTIEFRSINIEKRENRAIAVKYQISYTSLLLIHPDGTFTDFSTISLNYAYMNPQKFEELLKAEIDKNLE